MHYTVMRSVLRIVGSHRLGTDGPRDDEDANQEVIPMTEHVECSLCGGCCINNGLIPPLVPGEDAPEWLWCLVNRLRTEFANTAEDYPCVFLTDDMRCAIHDMERPSVCREFQCETAQQEVSDD